MREKIQIRNNEVKISPEQEKLIEELPIDDLEKVDLILTLLGFKSAIDIHVILKSWRPDEKEPMLSREEEQAILANVQAKIESLGLSSVIGESRHHFKPQTLTDEKTKTPFILFGVEWQELLVARTKEEAEKFKEICKLSEKEKAPLLGKLSGYPDSCIQAYQKYVEAGYRAEGILMELSDFPPDVREQDFMAFLQFRLSKDNWEKELETVKMWAEKIKTSAPKLYARIVERYKKSLTS